MSSLTLLIPLPSATASSIRLSAASPLLASRFLFLFFPHPIPSLPSFPRCSPLCSLQPFQLCHCPSSHHQWLVSDAPRRISRLSFELLAVVDSARFDSAQLFSSPTRSAQSPAPSYRPQALSFPSPPRLPSIADAGSLKLIFTNHTTIKNPPSPWNRPLKKGSWPQRSAPTLRLSLPSNPTKRLVSAPLIAVDSFMRSQFRFMCCLLPVSLPLNRPPS
jgi:hypothetical protein